MQVQKQSPPDHLQQILPQLSQEIAEYLTLEESEQYGSEQLSFAGYFVADGATGFLVFTYDSDGEPGIAFVQHPVNNKGMEDAAIGCWPITDGQSIEWALNEFLEYNPHLR
jgi:hypothetical protein